MTCEEASTKKEKVCEISRYFGTITVRSAERLMLNILVWGYLCPAKYYKVESDRRDEGSCDKYHQPDLF